MKCTWFRVLCTCFHVGRVAWLKASDRVSRLRRNARRPCKTCIFKNESYRKKRGLGKLIRKIVFGNVLPNIFFFCLGLAKIVFQLDAVKFAIELILSKQRPKFRLHELFWARRLEKQAIGRVTFANCKGTWYLLQLVMARKSVLNEINGFNHN